MGELGKREGSTKKDDGRATDHPGCTTSYAMRTSDHQWCCTDNHGACRITSDGHGWTTVLLQKRYGNHGNATENAQCPRVSGYKVAALAPTIILSASRKQFSMVRRGSKKTDSAESQKGPKTMHDTQEQSQSQAENLAASQVCIISLFL